MENTESLGSRNKDECMIYVLHEQGPDRLYRQVFDSQQEAEEALVRMKEWREWFVNVNNAPERKFYIMTYEKVDV